MKASGKVFKFGDNVDTDVIIPARYLNSSDPAELAHTCRLDCDRSMLSGRTAAEVLIRDRKSVV